jgi:hypothetical protein
VKKDQHGPADGGWRGVGRSGSAGERAVSSEEKVRFVKGIDGAGVFCKVDVFSPEPHD